MDEPGSDIETPDDVAASQTDGANGSPSAGDGGQAGDGPASASPPARAPRVRMADVARETAESIVQGRGGKLPAAGPKGAAKADPAGAAAAAAKPDPAAQPEAQGADPLSRMAALAASLPENVRGPLLAELESTRTYIGEVQSYARQVQELQQGVEAERERLTRIVNNPQVRAALDMVMNQVRGGAGVAGVAGGDGRLPELKDEQFETETERQLYQQNKILDRRLAETRQEFEKQINELRSGQENIFKERETQLTQQFQADVADLHTALDKQFPELAQDPKKLREWHALAARNWEPGSGKSGLRDALELAAKALHYEHATKQGATNALRSARNAAKSATQPDGFAGSTGDMPREGESLSDFGKRRAVAVGLQ